VLILPGERRKIEKIAERANISIRIIPRLAIGEKSPEKIIAFQLMGMNSDGDLCPFLNIDGKDLSPHGGFKCKIYPDRPLACKAYPVLSSNKKVRLDEHCRFCRNHSINSASPKGLQQELEALIQIKTKVVATNGERVWRYATATGKHDDKNNMFPEGWIRE
jgi:Fe-S-cluster containining protein